MRGGSARLRLAAKRLYSPSMSLIVTGTIGIDTVHTPTGKAEGVPGGSCAYFAAAASFQTPVRIVAAVGGDWPAEHRTILESFDNVCLAGLETRPDSSLTATPTWSMWFTLQTDWVVTGPTPPWVSSQSTLPLLA